MNDRSDTTNFHTEIFGTTTNPCPTWCTLPAGHGYDSEDTTCVTRVHSRDFGDVAGVYKEIAASVSLNAAENATHGDHRVLNLDEPLISVYSDGDEMTGPQAREMAAKLVAATDKLDQVTG